MGRALESVTRGRKKRSRGVQAGNFRVEFTYSIEESSLVPCCGRLKGLTRSPCRLPASTACQWPEATEYLYWSLTSRSEWSVRTDHQDSSPKKDVGHAEHTPSPGSSIGARFSGNCPCSTQEVNSTATISSSYLMFKINLLFRRRKKMLWT